MDAAGRTQFLMEARRATDFYEELLACVFALTENRKFMFAFTPLVDSLLSLTNLIWILR